MIVAALIPCRKGSKGIPQKNLRDLAGKRIWMWTLEAAVKSKVFNRIILSSDGGFSPEDQGQALCVLNCLDSGLIIDNDRPSEHARDDSSSDALLCYYARQYPEVETWALLQVTSPFRSAQDIKAAYARLQHKKYDSIVSVTPNPCMFWIEKAVGMKDKDHCIATYHVYKRPMRQERKDWHMENGAIYFTPKYVLEAVNNRLGGCIGLYKMPQERSFEIDTPFDWHLAELLFRDKRGVSLDESLKAIRKYSHEENELMKARWRQQSKPKCKVCGYDHEERKKESKTIAPGGY